MKRFDFEKVIQDMDAQLLEQDAINEEQKKWAEHDDSDILMGWVHDIIETKDVGDYAA